MPMRTDHFDGEETERVLGVVLCPTSYGKSMCEVTEGGRP